MTAVETHAPDDGGDDDAPSIGPGAVVAGKYRIDALVGEGGMGVVFAAPHEHLDERVALKVLRPSFAASKQATLRFLREARATAKLKNGHVTRVLDVDTLPDGTPYLVMELLEGEDLSSALERTGPLPVADAVRYVLDACEAVAEAHALGIVHRDLKPANLFVVRAPHTHVKVLDFGISRIMAGSSVKRGVETGANAIIGTPSYMAPEQHVRADSADERTDVFALGVILYELLTQRRPWEGDASPVIYALMMTSEPASIAERRPDVPAALTEIVKRCLKLEPAERFPSVRDLASALAPLIDARFPESGSRLVAPAPSTQAPVSRPAIEPAPPPKRRTAMLVAAGIGAFALIAIAIVFAARSPEPTHPSSGVGGPLPPPPTVETSAPPSLPELPPPPTVTAEAPAPPASHAPIVRKPRPVVTAAPAPAASASADPYKHRTSF